MASALVACVAACAASLLVACVGDGREGFQVWITNESDHPVVVRFEGAASLGDEEDPRKVSFLVDAGSVNLQGPFVYPFQSGLGAVVLLDTDCDDIGRFPVRPGDYRLRIDGQSEPEISELGAGERPSNASVAAGGRECVEP